MSNRRVYGVHVPCLFCLGWHAVRFVWWAFWKRNKVKAFLVVWFSRTHRGNTPLDRMSCKSWNHNAVGRPTDGDSFRSTHQFCSTQISCHTIPFVSSQQLNSYYDWIIFENRKLSNVYLPCFETACKHILCFVSFIPRFLFSSHYKRIKLSAASVQWIWLCRHIPNWKTDFGQ